MASALGAVATTVALAGCGAGSSQAGAVVVPAPSTWLETAAPSTRYEPAPTTSAAPVPEPATTSEPAPASSSAPAPHTTSPAAPTTDTSGQQTVTAALREIPTKGRAPKTGYSRDQFGPAWKDVDRNGCDTRNDVLARDLKKKTFKPGTRECVVLTGVLEDPYTGRTIDFTRGVGTSTAVQIDHVVALSDAWQKGAQGIGAAKRESLANDPLNLLAVDGPTNAGKSDGDAATWLPPRSAYRCKYVARQTAVKLKYGLWMTLAEKDAVQRVVRRCPGQTIPTH